MLSQCLRMTAQTSIAPGRINKNTPSAPSAASGDASKGAEAIASAATSGREPAQACTNTCTHPILPALIQHVGCTAGGCEIGRFRLGKDPQVDSLHHILFEASNLMQHDGKLGLGASHSRAATSGVHSRKAQAQRPLCLRLQASLLPAPYEVSQGSRPSAPRVHAQKRSSPGLSAGSSSAIQLEACPRKNDIRHKFTFQRNNVQPCKLHL